RMRFDDPNRAVIGSYQGLWPGIQVEENGAAKSAPSGAPWIDTNTGFLRFVRSYTDKPVWIANQPPSKTVVTVTRYIQAIGDAAMKTAKMAVDVDPGSLTPPQKDVLRNFTRAGGTLLSAPPGWTFPMPKSGEITLGKDDFKKLDEIWKEVNGMMGRTNLGAR